MLIFTRNHLVLYSASRFAGKSFSSLNTNQVSRYGLGGQNWKKFNPESYQELIYKALSKNVSYLEVAGHEGGDIAMVGAIQSALEQNSRFLSLPLTVTARFGYRNLSVQGSTTHEQTSASRQIENSIPGDVILTQVDKDENGTSTNDFLAHNFSVNYISRAAKSSPLLELLEMTNLKLIFLLHNPEAQVVDLLKENPQASFEERQHFIKDRLTTAMDTLQEFSASINRDHSKNIFSFGVCSNGVSIPKTDEHPMCMDANSIIEAAKKYDQFTTVQLPANLLETNGFHVAKQIKNEAPSITNLVAMRPLTCYPDLGTGSKHPFCLVDYDLPMLREDEIPDASTNSDECYTNNMVGIPVVYQMTLQAAMSHFDAEEILEYKQERELTVEERETLDGCMLMQSMIHDLDNQLAEIRSFAAHEDELYGRIIPLIHNTFELMDDKTSDILQAYFAAYAVAVRYSIAKQTRKLLREGEEEYCSGVTYSDIPQSMQLQEYALRHILKENCFDRILVGASTMQEFSHQIQLMESIDLTSKEKS